MRITLESVDFDADGQSLISDISFTFPSGSLTALIGPNGAGKTTLIRLMAGDYLPMGGSVRYGDEPLDSISVKRLARLRAVLPQSHPLETSFTVEQVVSMGRYVHRGSADDSVARNRQLVEDAIKSLDLQDIQNRPTRLLSGGEQQRVAIARVLAQEAPLVLFDEPTTALDLGHQEAVMALIRELGSRGHTVIAVLHDLNLATHFDQAVVMDRGSIVASGAPGDVLTSDVLSAVYDYPIDVVKHPLRSGVLVVPRRMGPSAR